MPPKFDKADFEAMGGMPLRPTHWMKPVTNPIDEDLFKAHLSDPTCFNRVVNVIPLKMYIDNAQGLCNLKKDNVNLAFLEQLKNELHGIICSKLACTQQKNDRYLPCVTYWELIRNEEGVVVCIAWHSIIQTTMKTPGDIILQLIMDNEEKISEALDKAKNPKYNNFAYSSLTLDSYRSMAAYYNPSRAKRSSHQPLNKGCITDESDNLCPSQLFSLDNALDWYAKCGAARVYFDHDYAEGFPYPADVYQVQAGMLAPFKIFTYMFPHLEPKYYSNDAERQLFSALHGEIRDENGDVTDPDLIFEEQVNLQTGVAGEKTFEQLGLTVQKMSSGVLDIMAHPTDSPAVKALKCQELQDSIDAYAMKEFETILTPLGSRGTAPVAITRWWHDEFLVKYKNACMPRKRKYSNISRVAELINEMCAGCETIYKIVGTHGIMVFYALSFMIVHRGGPGGYRMHHMAFGDAETSKSFTMNTAMTWPIPGSATPLSKCTPNSLNAPGREHCGMTFYLEETPPEMVGADTSVGKKGGSKSNDGSGDSSFVAMMKDAMWEGVAHTATNDGLKDGKQMRSMHKVWLECMFLFAMNIKEAMVSYPIRTRCHLTHFTLSARECQMSGGATAPDAHRIEADFVLRIRRFQALSMNIYDMQKAKILPQVNDTIADVIIIATMREAFKAGCNGTTLKRTYQRLRMLVVQLVVMDVIDAIFDIEGSPIADEPFNYRQLLAARKLLVATSDHVSIALGFTQSAYENPVRYQIMDHLKSKLLATGVYRRRTDLAAQGYEVNEFGDLRRIGGGEDQEEVIIPVVAPVAPVAFDPTKLQVKGATVVNDVVVPPYDNTKDYDDYYYIHDFVVRKNSHDTRDRLDIFIDHVWSTMPMAGRPSFTETDSCIRDLTTSLVSIRNINGKRANVYKLVVSETQLKVAFPCIDGNQKNVLRAAFTKVMCHPHTVKKTLLWGHAEDLMKPYEMPVINIQPVRRHATDRRGQRHITNLMTVRNSNYFNKGLLGQTKNFIEGVHANAREQVTTPVFKRVFADRPRYAINADLDVLAVQSHLNEQRITRKAADEYPAADPAIRSRQELMLIEESGRKLGVYPDYPPPEEEERLDQETHCLKTHLDELDLDPEYKTPADLHMTKLRQVQRMKRRREEEATMTQVKHRRREGEREEDIVEEDMADLNVPGEDDMDLDEAPLDLDEEPDYADEDYDAMI